MDQQDGKDLFLKGVSNNNPSRTQQLLSRDGTTFFGRRGVARLVNFFKTYFSSSLTF
jgi:hypothetical protein